MNGIRRLEGPGKVGEHYIVVGERHRKMNTAQTQAPAVVRDVVCEVCGRKFRRESDRKRH